MAAGDVLTLTDPADRQNFVTAYQRSASLYFRGAANLESDPAPVKKGLGPTLTRLAALLV